MSYNEFAHSFFEDDDLLLIEKVTKILDYFKREKILSISKKLEDQETVIVKQKKEEIK